MKSVFLVMMVGGLALLSGCTFLDAITGVNRPEGAPPGVVTSTSTFLGGMPGWLGLVGTLLGAGGTAYKHVRERHYSSALASVVAGIDNATAAGSRLTLTKDELYQAIGLAINKGVSRPEEVIRFIGEIKSALRSV